MKRRIAFALLMGVVTTGIISLTLTLLNTDHSGIELLATWFKSWGAAYVVVIPCILIISPLAQKIVDRLIKDRQ